MVSVELTADAQQQVLELPKAIRARVYRAIERLADWPNVSGQNLYAVNWQGVIGSEPATTEFNFS